jgi:hypothetical protein
VGHSSTYLITKVKQSWARIVLGWVITRMASTPGSLRGCSLIFCPGKTWEKTPRWVIPPVGVRGRLHVYRSAYESPYDSKHDLHWNRIGFQLFIWHLLQWLVYKKRRYSKTKKIVQCKKKKRPTHRLSGGSQRRRSTCDITSPANAAIYSQRPRHVSTDLFLYCFFLIYWLTVITIQA